MSILRQFGAYFAPGDSCIAQGSLKGSSLVIRAPRHFPQGIAREAGRGDRRILGAAVSAQFKKALGVKA
jgi:hypothetical protein